MKKDTSKKPVYKKWWFWAIIIFIGLCIIVPNDSISDSDSDIAAENQGDVNDESSDLVAENESPDAPNSKQSDSSDAIKSDSEKSVSEMPDETSIKLASYGVVFIGDVNNDVTGNWRYATYYSDVSQETIAVDYCNTYFKSDNEVHALINEANNTVACIQHMTSDLLGVTIHKYSKGEELDAKELFGGDVIAEYFVTISTGEIEEVSEE